MDKLKMHTENKVDINIEKIGSLFPNTLTEKIKGYDENDKPIIEKAIDFDILKQELSKVIVEGREERYQMNWPGKKEAILTANAPINKTLRPYRDENESVDFDTTENLYIEGDNLEVLKLLQETYLNKIKMIYIDPPYNTGNDSFVYNDDFSMSNEDFSEASGQYDEDGNMNYDIRKNSESNGRFHTDWLNMMYPRLKLAKDLLSDDGVIFISIDDIEVDNLKKIGNDIFGENNFIGCISRATGTTTGQDANKIGSSIDYCLVYSKGNNFTLRGLPMSEEDMKRFKECDEKGRYSILQLRKTGNNDRKEDRPNMFYPVIAPDNSKVYPFGPTGYLSRWRVGQDTLKNLLDNNMVVWKKNDDIKSATIDGYERSKWVPYVKYYLEGRTKQVSNLFQNIDGNKKGSLELKELLEKKGIFDNPKPVQFIKILLQISVDNDDTILDFFSGSATTAHAVMQLNAEDGGNRKFIMVQLPEETDEKSEARKAGYENICQIGKERIRRAGKKIKEENPDVADKLDTGFRVLKLDSSNMKDVYYNPSDYNQDMIEALESNIKDDRSNEDLLFQVMLDLGELLSSDIKEINIQGKKVFNVGDGNIIACFDEDITNEVLTEIAKMQPYYAVFRDSSLSNDSVVTNFEQIFKTYSPNTITKVL